MTAREMQRAMVDELGMEPDEAAHALADMGEIDSIEHEELLSEEEAERAYGSRVL